MHPLIATRAATKTRQHAARSWRAPGSLRCMARTTLWLCCTGLTLASCWTHTALAQQTPASESPPPQAAPDAAAQTDAAQTSAQPDAAQSSAQPDAAQTSAQPDAAQSSAQPDAAQTQPAPEAAASTAPAPQAGAETGFVDATTTRPDAASAAQPAAPPPEAAAPANTSPKSAVDDDYESTSLADTYQPPPRPEPIPFLLGLWWELNFPMGSSRDFVRKVDPAGFALEGRFQRLAAFGNMRLGAGFLVSWNSMQEKTRSSIQSGNATITGTQVRELSTTPLLGKVHLAWGDVKKTSPYVAYSFGATRVLRRLDIGIYRFAQESWHVAMAPEIGIEAPLGFITALANVKVNYLIKTKDAPEQLYLNFCLGAGFH